MRLKTVRASLPFARTRLRPSLGEIWRIGWSQMVSPEGNSPFARAMYSLRIVRPMICSVRFSAARLCLAMNIMPLVSLSSLLHGKGFQPCPLSARMISTTLL